MHFTKSIQIAFGHEKIPRALLTTQTTGVLRICLTTLSQEALLSLLRCLRLGMSGLSEISLGFGDNQDLFDAGSRHEQTVNFSQGFLNQPGSEQDNLIELPPCHIKPVAYSQKRTSIYMEIIQVILSHISTMDKLQVIALYNMPRLSFVPDFSPNQNLQVIILDYCQQSVECFSFLLNIFLKSNKISTLSLRSCSLDGIHIKSLAIYIKKQIELVKTATDQKLDIFILKMHGAQKVCTFPQRVVARQTLRGISWLDLSENKMTNGQIKGLFGALSDSSQLQVLNLKGNNFSLQRDIVTPEFQKFFNFSMEIGENPQKLVINKQIYEDICDKYHLNKRQRDLMMHLAPEHQYLGLETTNIVLNYLHQIANIDRIIALLQNSIVQLVMKCSSIMSLTVDSFINDFVDYICGQRYKAFMKSIQRLSIFPQSLLENLSPLQINLELMIAHKVLNKKLKTQHKIQKYAQQTVSFLDIPTYSGKKKAVRYYGLKEKVKMLRKGKFGIKRKYIKRIKVTNTLKQTKQQETQNPSLDELFDLQQRYKELQQQHNILISSYKNNNVKVCEDIQSVEIVKGIVTPRNVDTQQSSVLKSDPLDQYLFQRVLDGAIRALTIVHQGKQFAQQYYETNKNEVLNQCELVYQKIHNGRIPEDAVTAVLISRFSEW
ncbi:hypothetical protein SS50377_27162 [Spironucleus salmonicida]|uniref:Uncharacterized protein n=2 Tax=Spironucleus TaxID=39709 RepID=V6LH11_9EUKA|nr:hypothetical protein SS50377_27162 [Spironucleus salmonicida]|eukprot:EST43840.1 hypothetical protein SS50377_16384 [Spironucleus salmonicida]